MGKGTNQHGNGFALSTYVLLLLRRFTTYIHTTFGFATARLPLNEECCVGPAPCAFGNDTPSLRCAHCSAASVLAIVHRHRFATNRASLPWSDVGHAEPYPEPALPPSALPPLFLPVPGSLVSTLGHVLGLWINPWVFWGYIPH